MEENERRKKYDENYRNKLDEYLINYNEIESFILEQNKNSEEEKEIISEKEKLILVEIPELIQEGTELEKQKVELPKRLNELSFQKD